MRNSSLQLLLLQFSEADSLSLRRLRREHFDFELSEQLRDLEWALRAQRLRFSEQLLSE